MRLKRIMTGCAPLSGERGFTLIELMIAIGLSLMILAGLLTVFVSNSNTRKEIERTTRQIENGRYGTDLLSNNLAHAAFFAEFDPRIVSAPGTLPEACSTADLDAGLALPIQGYRNAKSNTVGLDCLADLKEDTDVVVVRRVSTCVAQSPPATSCDELAKDKFYYFQTSLCTPPEGGAELANSDYKEWYRLSSDTSKLDRHVRTCMDTGCVCTSRALADIRRYHVHIYFVAKNSVGTDGVPTLKRAELTGSGFTIVPLVEGIENLKLEYGIDSNGDGMPESYTTTPATVDDWRNVTSAKVYLLARSTERSVGYTDTKTYTLDSATTIDPASDSNYDQRYRRQVFSTTVKLANIAGRRGI